MAGLNWDDEIDENLLDDYDWDDETDWDDYDDYYNETDWGDNWEDF